MSCSDEVAVTLASQSLHNRFNPLTRSWVLCSSTTSKRSWPGPDKATEGWQRTPYDTECNLCPGGRRDGVVRIRNYYQSFLYEDSFAAMIDGRLLLTESPSQVETARGKCFVMAYSPRHDLTIAEMNDSEISSILDAWTKLYMEVSMDHPWLRHIQIFENNGSIEGCVNSHSHGQAWSLSYVPFGPADILESSMHYGHSGHVNPNAPCLANGLPSLLISYATSEIDMHKFVPEESRVTYLSEHFVALVPFWASSPFETIIIPFKRHISSLAVLRPDETRDLAHVIGAVNRRLDNLLQCPWGYSMEVFQAPVYRPTASPSGLNQGEWGPDGSLPTYQCEPEAGLPGEFDWADFVQLHVGFYPPRFRSVPSKKRIMGHELFAATQTTITPEKAAKRLRECADDHYSQRLKCWKTSTGV